MATDVKDRREERKLEHLAHYQGMAEGMANAVKLANHRAAALFAQNKDPEAQAVRSLAQDLLLEQRQLEQALNGDQLEHPRGL